MEKAPAATKKRVAVVGSRTFRDYAFMCEKLDPMRETIGTIVSGGAQGADRYAERYAREHSIKTLILKPDWKKGTDLGAGLRRNTDIVANAEIVIAFWDGKSTGTMDTVKKANRTGKQVVIHRFIN